MDFERVFSLLVRGRRDCLWREIGPGALAGRLAHFEIHGEVAALLAASLEREARHLEGVELPLRARELRDVAQDLRGELDDLREGIAAIESGGIKADSREKYAGLRLVCTEVRDQGGVREAVNRVVQGGPALGWVAYHALERMLTGRCAELGFPLPADCQARLEEAARRLSEAWRAEKWRLEAAERTRELPPLGGLAQEIETLAERAAALSKEDLFDAIEFHAARLKTLQESSPGAGKQDQAVFRRAFGVLSKLSKSFKPGYTPLLESGRQGEDWPAFARAAAARMAEREAERARLRLLGRQEQIHDAVTQLRERARNQAFDEAIQRLRALLAEDPAAEGDPGGAGREAGWRHAVRTQAAMALRAGAGLPAVASRLVPLLQGRSGLIACGREFKLLRAHLGLPESSAPASAERPGRETAEQADYDAEQVDQLASALEEEWPAEIAQLRGVGEGERVWLVGGQPQLGLLPLLKEFFSWQKVEWIESYRTRQADFQALQGRIRQGGVDRVIVLARFCGHDVSQTLGPSCRVHGVSYHVHPRGVSVAALAQVVYGAR